MPLTSGSRPSEHHVVWPTPEGSGPDRAVDPRPLVAWSQQFDFDVEQTTAVDHDRADGPRPQVRSVFRHERADTHRLTMGDRTWTLGGHRTAGAFIELDDRGTARIRTWEEDVVLDLESLRVDGPHLVLESDEFFGEKRIDGREVGAPEPPAVRDTSRFW